MAALSVFDFRRAVEDKLRELGVTSASQLLHPRRVVTPTGERVYQDPLTGDRALELEADRRRFARDPSSRMLAVSLWMDDTVLARFQHVRSSSPHT